MPKDNFEVELLYFSHASFSKTLFHCHSYFQLEYCIKGQLEASDNGQKLFLNPGDYWLIPPGRRHSFHKSKNIQDFVSVKFSASVAAESKIGHDPVVRYYLDRIRAVLDNETPFSPYAVEGKTIIENHLSGILNHLTQPEIEAPKSKFETMLQNTIYELGAVANVDALAQRNNLTRDEFKYRFRKEIGHGQIKDYIASILLKIIEEHLLYSDSPLNKVADELNFPSIYAFSRYFKHHRGITPSAFRSKAKLQQPPPDVSTGL